MKDELRSFEIHLFQCYTDSLNIVDHKKKQEMLGDFINKYAFQIREYFCKNVCKKYKYCEVYERLSKSEHS